MVTVTQSFLIKPAKPTPTGPMCVSELDQEKPLTHALTVYLYPSPTNSFSFPSASQLLRQSLSQLLVHFYPLAGRLHYIPAAGGRLTLQCNPNSNSYGVVFNEAESSAKIEDFQDNSLPSLGLVPMVDYGVSKLHELPLLLVQLTQLSCGGFSLGIAVSNVMVDGTCASHFLAEWSRIARGLPLENQPVLDRGVLLAADPPAAQFKHDRFEPNPLLIGHSNDEEERNKETTTVMLHLTKDQVEKLKEMANEGRPSYITRPFSRFEAVAGHIWRCASKARGHEPMQQTRLYIPVSIRGRMPLPNWYFGNGIMKQAASAGSGELVKCGLPYACSRIREALEVVNEEYVKSALNDNKRQSDLAPFRGCFDGNPNMEIISWLGIPFEGLDFGWGENIGIRPATINVDGKCIVLPGEGGDGHGSVSVALCFQVSHVDNFKNHFYQLLQMD